MQRTRKKESVRFSTASRLHIVMACVFLSAGLVAYRLIALQVFAHDRYLALAAGQQELTAPLEPVRGRIFMTDKKAAADSTLFPLATNKDFANVFAVPSEVTEAERAAEELFKLFDELRIRDELKDFLKDDPYFAAALDEKATMTPAERIRREEYRQTKVELEFASRKKVLIDTYRTKLDKRDDPYEPLKNKVDEKTLEQLLALNLAGIRYVMEPYRFYPEGTVGAHLTGFVGYEAEAKSGRYGLEGFFNGELTGAAGQVTLGRTAKREAAIIAGRELTEAVDGSDLILTIDRSIQYEACTKLDAAVAKHGAENGTVIVMEPKTGAIIAMCSTPNYDPNDYQQAKDVRVFNNPAIFDDYEPGSVFKVITMAAGLDQGKVTPKTTYTDKGFVMVAGWPKPIKNSDYETKGGHGLVDMVHVLEYSLNTGAMFVMDKVSSPVLAQYVQSFGFGEKTGIELMTEGLNSIGNLERKTIRPIEAATASFGQGITVTPLQLAAAYAAVANGGLLMKPYLVNEIIRPDGTRSRTQPQTVRRVMAEKAALQLGGMMVSVIENGHTPKAQIKGYYVAGKTGTAQIPDRVNGGYGAETIHTFIGFAPAEEPRFVMLVKLNKPKDVKFADSSAAPLFADVAEFILNYYQVPKERL